MKAIWYWGIVVFILGCSTEPQAPDISKIEVELSLFALEDEFRACKTIDQVHAFAARYPKFSVGFLGYQPQKSEEIAQRIVEKTNLPQYDTLYFACKKNIVGIEKAKDELNKAMRYLKYYYPEVQLPSQIYTIVSGYEEGADMYTNGEILVWGLEYALGGKLPYRPPAQLQLHSYMLERMTPSYLPINFMLMLSTKLNQYDILEQSMLADMMFYGKAYYFLEKIFPNYPDSLLIGFTQQQIDDAHFNETEIWAHFVKNELLYQSNISVKNRYLGERPKVSEIAEECPGRIGRWLGWQIVRSYAKRNKKLTLQDLMKETDANKIFRESAYKPTSRKSTW
jgi:hypothetical protein